MWWKAVCAVLCPARSVAYLNEQARGFPPILMPISQYQCLEHIVVKGTPRYRIPLLSNTMSVLMCVFIPVLLGLGHQSCRESPCAALHLRLREWRTPSTSLSGHPTLVALLRLLFGGNSALPICPKSSGQKSCLWSRYLVMSAGVVFGRLCT